MFQTKLILTLTIINVALAIEAYSQKSEPDIIPLQNFTGYYAVGVKPNKPFFRSRWYLRDNQLYTIYDSDEDRLLEPYEDGQLKYNIFLNEEDVPEVLDDTTYYLVLNFKEEVLESFKVLRPRKDWPTDLYGYRISKLDDLAVDTEEKLTQQLITDHFRFEYSNQDSSIIAGMAETLEERYKVLLSDFELSSLTTTKVRIYPDKPTYNNAVLTPNAPIWQMGRVWDNNEIRMLSPISAQNLTGEKMEINLLTLHEFVHAIHLNLIEDGITVPGWLWEGLAMYKGCCQWTNNPFELDYMKKGKFPSLAQIEKDRSNEMKYDLGYYLIKYIDEKYGWSKVLALIKSNGNLKSALGIPQKQFEKGFYADLKRQYN
ncbi:MAG: hypothetical protein AAFN93_04900 [Bacteroidota bacterium]